MIAVLRKRLFSSYWMAILATVLLIETVALIYLLAHAKSRSGPTVVAEKRVQISQLDWIERLVPAGQSQIAVYGGFHVVNVWAVLVHFWPETLALLAVIPTVILVRRSCRRHGAEEYCGDCGYCLRGLTSPRCPECGLVLGKHDRIRGTRNLKTIRKASAVAGLIAIVCAICILKGQRFGGASSLFKWESRRVGYWIETGGPKRLRSLTAHRSGVVIVDPSSGRVVRAIDVSTPIYCAAFDSGRYLFVESLEGLGLLKTSLGKVHHIGPYEGVDPVFLGETPHVVWGSENYPIILLWNIEHKSVDRRFLLPDSMAQKRVTSLCVANLANGSTEIRFALTDKGHPYPRGYCSVYRFMPTPDDVKSSRIEPVLVLGTMLSDTCRKIICCPNGLLVFECVPEAVGNRAVWYSSATHIADGGNAMTITSPLPVGFDGCTSDGRWLFGKDDHSDDGRKVVASPILYLWPAPVPKPAATTQPATPLRRIK